MTFDELYTAIKTYADTKNMTLAQLAKVKQRQVANALSLSKADQVLLGRCWDSLRRRVRDQWREDEAEGKFQAFVADVMTKVKQRFPLATFSREGDGRFIIDINGDT